MISALVVVWPSLGKTGSGLRRRTEFRGSIPAVNGRPVAEQLLAASTSSSLGSKQPEMYRDTVASATRNFAVGAG